MEDGMAFVRADSAGYLATRLARLVTGAFHRRIAPMGIAPAQFSVLLEVAQTANLTQRDLVRRLDVEQGTMTNTLSRMERDGLILRRAHPLDARSQTIVLTAKAEAALPAAVAAAEEVNREALAALSESERRRFIQLLQRVVEHCHDLYQAEQPQPDNRIKAPAPRPETLPPPTETA
jgi:DNA-binding MarR family transcriptional regulator